MLCMHLQQTNRAAMRQTLASIFIIGGSGLRNLQNNERK